MDVNEIGGYELDLYGRTILEMIREQHMDCKAVLNLRSKDKTFKEWLDGGTNITKVYKVLLETDPDLAKLDTLLVYLVKLLHFKWTNILLSFELDLE